MKTTSVTAGLLLAASFALTACAGGSGNPVPQSSATPGPPADYFPMSNSAEFQVAMPSPSLGFVLWYAALGVRSGYGVSCDSASDVIGDYFADPDLLVPDVEQVMPQLTGSPAFVYSDLIVTKNSANDLIVDGYVSAGTTLEPGATTCVTPYVLMKSNARAGDTWSYTDIAGRAVTAVVVFDHQPKSYNANGATQSYSSVTEVNYGADFTIDWAQGYGPVQVTEHGAQAGEPLSYTAFGYTIGVSN